MKMFDIPCWASLGADRLAKVEIPSSVRKLYVFADNGRAGELGAEQTIAAHKSIKPVALFPPDDFGDWNDALQDRRTA